MRAAIHALLATAAGASVASAQRTQHTQPATAPRVAAIAPAPAPQMAPGNWHRFNRHGGFRDDFPILLLSDGRVFANFGRGFEQIVRSCPLSSGYSSLQIVSPSGLEQPVVVQPTVTQPSIPPVARLPYTPPVPAQQTTSQQMAEQGGRLPQSVASESCWAVSQNGRIVVAQP